MQHVLVSGLVRIARRFAFLLQHHPLSFVII
jgi:hypothetical protein